MKRKRMSKGPFVAIPKAIMATPAWRAMTPEGRLLWIELRGWLRNDGLNNGKVRLSCRDAAKAIGLSKNTVVRRYAENEHFGFLRKTAEGFLGSDGRGIAAKYRFTDLAHGTHPPTRDFEKWDGKPFIYSPRRRKNPVRKTRTPRPKNQDIRKVGNGGAVCPTAPDIGAASDCPKNPDISRLPLPAVGQRGEGEDQGSSTARAPVQAGGAGSSPAPDAKPDLTMETEVQPPALGPYGEPGIDYDRLNREGLIAAESCYGHAAREQEEQACPAAMGKPPDADQAEPAAWEPYSERGRDERRTHEALMAHVASVVEEQLKQLDQGVAAPAQAAPPLPTLPGDRRREEQRARNLEALRRFETKLKERAH